MKYSAIDLHSNNSVVSVTDEEDRVVVEKRLPNDLAKILGFLLPWREELAGVVVESTFNWYWLVDGLQAAGFITYLANTTAIKKYDGLKHSGDEADARYLAHLLRLGILPTGTILPPEQRAVRDLARKRMQLVRSRTAHILAVENIIARQHGTRISSNQVKRLTTEAVDQMSSVRAREATPGSVVWPDFHSSTCWLTDLSAKVHAHLPPDEPRSSRRPLCRR
jgi:transposase